MIYFCRKCIPCPDPCTVKFIEFVDTPLHFPYSKDMIHRFFSYLFKHQIIFGLFIIATGWLVIQLREIILSVFVAYIFMSALLPYSKILRKIGMPKSLSVFIPCFIVLVGIFLLVVPLVPFIITQAQEFITKFPNYLNQTATAMEIDFNIK